MIGDTVGHYRILDELGTGGMGVVYQARDLRLKRTVALKFLPPELSRDAEAKRRFLKEAEAAAALDHPNICTVYEVGETEEGQLFIVMACYTGETLKDRLKRGPLTPAEASWVAVQAAAGLSQAHARGIVHRDIKPANLMLTTDGGVKILDFGLAKLLGETTRTQDGGTLGTVAYMSTEQAGGRKVDERTDIWSLGAVLYEMVTGEVPFGGTHPQGIIYGILNHDPVAPSRINPAIPADLERVILLCLAKEPDQRIQSMAEVVAELGEAGLTGPVVTARKPRHLSLWTRLAVSWLRRHRLAVLLVVLLIAAAAGVTYWRWSQVPPPAQPEKLLLAVLPFENLEKPEKEYIADGVTDQLIGRLSQVHALRVISRASVMEYKKTTKRILDIADELGVDYILQGTIRWGQDASGGGQIRVATILTRAADGTNMWSEQYDVPAGEILTTQAKIAEKVAAALQVKLVESERKGLAAVSTRNAAAYECLLKGDTANDYQSEERLNYYKEAVRLDPNFTDAYLAIFGFYLNKREPNDPPDVRGHFMNLAWRALEKVRELDPDSPLYHRTLALYYAWFKSDWKMAEEEYLIALRGLPGDFAILAGLRTVTRYQGKWMDSMHYAEQLADLNPRLVSPFRFLGQCYLEQQRYPNAEVSLIQAMDLYTPEGVLVSVHLDFAEIFIWRDRDPKRALEYLNNLPSKARERVQTSYGYLFHLWYAGQNERILELLPTFRQILSRASGELILNDAFRGDVLRSMGRLEESRKAYTEALRVMEERRKLFPDDPQYPMSHSLILAGLSRKAEAIREARAGVTAIPRENDVPAYLQRVYYLAAVYATVGEYDLAMDQLEIVLNEPCGYNINKIRVTPTFKSILALPRFQELERKYPPDKPYLGIPSPPVYLAP